MFLSEIDTSELQNVCFTAGSTHILKTCKIGQDKYFLKFSDEELFDSHDPSLQILIEYLAYKIYSLYQGVHVPKNIHLVFDKQNKKVGLATQAVMGNKASQMPPEVLAKKLSAGVYVDIFLANWDVIGVGAANVVSNKDSYRIDPGGALTFRAQGGRKGKNFSANPGELKTMLDPSSGTGTIFQYSDLKIAAKTFLSVNYQKIAATIQHESDYITSELTKLGMNKLLAQWNDDVQEIVTKLKPRHDTITLHAKKLLTESAFKFHAYDLLIEGPRKKSLKPFGNIFAGEERGLPNIQQPEPNTPSETKLIGDLYKHLGSQDQWAPLDSKSTKAIKNVLAAKKEYGDVFIEPSVKYVFRGMKIDKASFEKLFGFIPDKNKRRGIKKFDKSVVFKPKQKNCGSSWTKERRIAFAFSNFYEAERGLSDFGIACILQAKTSDNKGKLFDVKNLYGNVLDPEFKDEKEVIGLGDVIVDGLEYVVSNMSESKLNELSVDEPDGGQFGKVLFGDQRIDDVDEEKNTTSEEEAFWALENHYNKNSDDKLNTAAKTFVDLAGNNKYKDILRPPSGFVYRVIGMDIQSAAKLFDITPRELMDSEQFVYKEMSKYAARQTNSIQSWAFNPEVDVLSDFAGKAPVTVMFKAKCPDDGKFFMNPYGLSKLDLIGKWHREKEVISYGPVKIAGAAYYCHNGFVRVSHNEIVDNLLRVSGRK